MTHTSRSLLMNATVKNALIAGVAGLFIVAIFAIVQLQNSQSRIAEARNLDLSAILEDPTKYDSLDVSVEGFLLWHSDEPTLFVDEHAFQEMDFKNSIQLQMSSEVDFQFANEKPVIASGSFYFDPEDGRQLLGYKGDVDLSKKLDEWEQFYNFARPHGAHQGHTPYESLREKLT